MKLYIAILDSVPYNMAPLLVAHAVLSAHLKFSGDERYEIWIKSSFRKCVVRVNRKEFEKISQLYNVHIGFESTILDGEPCCVVIAPREEIPNVLKFAKLWI